MNNVLKVILILVGIFVGLAFLSVGIGLFVIADAITSSASNDEESTSISGTKVALVEVKDVITSSEEIIRQLKKYQKNSNVKAIVVRVESPGGGIAPSQEIYETIKSIRNSGKPVVISMGSMAASGGYYISLGANKIFANPGTLTGSIGVILEYPNFTQLMDKVGVNMTTVKSGKMKDAGSPYRKSSVDDQKYFQELIDNGFEQFIDAVVQERKIDKAELLKLADGRVFTGRQAYNYNLVDTLGTYDDAIRYAGKLGGIEGEPKTVKEKKKQALMDVLLSKIFDKPLSKASELFSSPNLQYKFSID
jgi:protease IV